MEFGFPRVVFLVFIGVFGGTFASVMMGAAVLM
jgi:hypothetical protein